MRQGDGFDDHALPEVEHDEHEGLDEASLKEHEEVGRVGGLALKLGLGRSWG